MLDKHQQLLRSIPLFAGLDAEQLARVVELAQVKRYAARHAVVTQGEPASELFAIVHGRVKVISCSPEGKDTVLGIMSEGEVFGEIALLDAGVRSATCTTIEPCELLLIHREPFLRLLQTAPSIAIVLLDVLAKRLRRLSQRSEDAAFLDVPSRLARSLLDLASRFGERDPAPSREIQIGLRLSQQELGDLVGATRESVNKHLSEWSRQGLVSLRAGRMIIADIEGIRRLARVADE